MRGSTRLQNDLAMALLEEQGVMLVDGHYDFGNGYHGRSYLNPHPLLDHSSQVIKLAHELCDVVPYDIRKQVQIVVGPVTGGLLLAMAASVALETERDYGSHHKVLHAPLYRMPSHELGLREHHRKLIAGGFMKPGLNALVVDDVINTGKTLKDSCRIVEDAGGIVLATAVLYDRQAAIEKLKNHFSVTCCDTDPQLVRVEDCEQCRFGVPISQF